MIFSLINKHKGLLLIILLISMAWLVYFSPFEKPNKTIDLKPLTYDEKEKHLLTLIRLNEIALKSYDFLETMIIKHNMDLANNPAYRAELDCRHIELIYKSEELLQRLEKLRKEKINTY